MEMGNTLENFKVRVSFKLFIYCSEIFIYFSNQNISKICVNQMKTGSNQIKKPKTKTFSSQDHF